MDLEHIADWEVKKLNVDLFMDGKNRFTDLKKMDEFRNEAY